ARAAVVGTGADRQRVAPVGQRVRRPGERDRPRRLQLVGEDRRGGGAARVRDGRRNRRLRAERVVDRRDVSVTVAVRRDDGRRDLEAGEKRRRGRRRGRGRGRRWRKRNRWTGSRRRRRRRRGRRRRR